MDYLTPKELKRMMLFSWERIEQEKEEINKINVFPVPDQDTGNNLAHTLLGIKESIEKKEFKSLDDISKAILEGAMVAAQGNAGVIYTGFLAGFLPVLKNQADSLKLSLAFRKGAQKARESIQNPKEGTILDVIDAASKTFEREVKEEKDIILLLQKAKNEAHQALLKTREKMEIFRKANVVDAGGLGFLMILEGFLDALEGEEKGKKEKREEKVSEKVRRFVQTISYRYEVVALIIQPRLKDKEIQERLSKLGNSLDIVSTKDKTKIHIHTDLLDEVEEALRQVGKVQSLRVEDMAKEVAGEESIRKVSIGIVTDMVADLTPKIIERYQIEIVPYQYDWPEVKELPGKNIYQKMKEADKKGVKQHPQTPQPSPRIFLKAYKKQLEKFEKVLIIVVSSKLSGSHNSALQARSILEDPSRVHVFDSLLATAGQALLVLRAIELIQEQRELLAVVRELKKDIPKIHICGFLANPSWVEKGGRISKSQVRWMRNLQKIGVRPLIGLKGGKIAKVGFRFGVKEIPESIFREIEAKSKKLRKQGKKIRVVITHADNAKGAQELKKRLKDIHAEVSFINLVTPVVGVHTGPGSLIAAWTLIE